MDVLTNGPLLMLRAMRELDLEKNGKPYSMDEVADRMVKIAESEK